MEKAVLLLFFWACLHIPVSRLSAQCVAAKPTGLVADGVAACRATLHWNPVPSVAYYKVQYKIDGASTWTKIKTKLYGTSFTFSGLLPVTPYKLGVVAYCSSSNKSKLASKKVTTPGCDIPVLRPIKINNQRNVTLSWTTCLSTSFNEVKYRKKSEASWHYVLNGASQQFTLNSIDTGVLYYFQISACSDTSLWTSRDSFIIGRPNILVIILDDARYDSYSCNGAPSFIQTPGIDRIANEGVNFRNSFTVYSLCAPSRASLYTGLYPHNNGAFNNECNYNTALPTVPPGNHFG